MKKYGYSIARCQATKYIFKLITGNTRLTSSTLKLKVMGVTVDKEQCRLILKSTQLAFKLLRKAQLTV